MITVRVIIIMIKLHNSLEVRNNNTFMPYTVCLENYLSFHIKKTRVSIDVKLVVFIPFIILLIFNFAFRQLKVSKCDAWQQEHTVFLISMLYRMS
jgi:hypothetical protein